MGDQEPSAKHTTVSEPVKGKTGELVRIAEVARLGRGHAVLWQTCEVADDGCAGVGDGKPGAVGEAWQSASRGSPPRKTAPHCRQKQLPSLMFGRARAGR